jgi:hypothetical protein
MREDGDLEPDDGSAWGHESGKRPLRAHHQTAPESTRRYHDTWAVASDQR